MLDAILAIYLWVIVFSFFCWLSWSGNHQPLDTKKDESGEKELLATLESLNSTQIRKLAVQLGTGQRVNGRYADKKLLTTRIKTKITTHPQEVTNALQKVLSELTRTQRKRKKNADIVSISKEDNC